MNRVNQQLIVNIMNNYIITPWDSRYDKLGHLWRRYNWNNLVRASGRSRTYLYIPPELVLREYNTKSGMNLLRNPRTSKDNWIYKRDQARLLKDSCDLSIQDYFDLLVLRINNKSDRPKCPICGEHIPFYSTYYGYGSPYTSWVNKNSLCCSHRCSNILRWNDETDWFNSEEAIIVFSENAKNLWRLGKLSVEMSFDFSRVWTDPGLREKLLEKRRSSEYKMRCTPRRQYSTFIRSGDLSDQCVLYMVHTTNSTYKFGITSNLDQRLVLLSRCEKVDFDDYEVLLEDTRLRVANMESWIKLNLGSHSEYFDESKLDEFRDVVVHSFDLIDESPYPDILDKL